MPAVQRARRRLRPRQPPVQGRARRRRVGDQRPEGVDVGRAGRRPRHADRPHRRRRAQAQGHHVLRDRDGPARRRRPAAARDDRPGAVQRGVLRRRPRPRLGPHRRPRQGLGGRPTRRSPTSAPASAAGGSGAVGGAAPGAKARMLGKRVGDLASGGAGAAGRSALAGKSGQMLHRRRPRPGSSTTTRVVRQQLARAVHADRDRPVHVDAGEGGQGAGQGARSRGEHRQAHDEPDHPAVTRPRARDPRAERDAGGQGRAACTGCSRRWRCSRRPCRSTAAATRCRRTSSASGSSGCPRSPAPTDKTHCRSASSRSGRRRADGAATRPAPPAA